MIKVSIRSVALALLANAAVLLVLLVPVELIFGTWIRDVGFRDLRRFSIPVGVTYATDASHLYAADGNRAVHYTRDQYGLRGSPASLADVEVLTMGGSTTDQRYLDDAKTWQAVAEREFRSLTGRAIHIANAGVDGQSTVGQLFDFDSWLPLLPGLKPKVVVFYVGINDVLARQDRDAYDRAVDARSWRFRSATYQLVRTIRSNLRARSVRAAHGRMPESTPSSFTDRGLLEASERDVIAEQVSDGFLTNVDQLRVRTTAWGARPVFMTQTAFAWNADDRPPKGVSERLQILGRTVNYADVASIHQWLNRRLRAYCASQDVTCLDLANDVEFDIEDYYDYLHNTPRGAEKIGRYLAEKLACLDRTCPATP